MHTSIITRRPLVDGKNTPSHKKSVNWRYQYRECPKKGVYFVYLALSSKENKIKIKSIKSSTVGKAQKSMKEKSNKRESLENNKATANI